MGVSGEWLYNFYFVIEFVRELLKWEFFRGRVSLSLEVIDGSVSGVDLFEGWWGF